MKHLSHRLLAVSAAAALLLSSCEPQARGHATPEAAEQFAELMSAITPANLPEWEPEQIDSIQHLIEHFADTADARYTLPEEEGAYTILHLACYFKKPELARCLLLDGANPNARAMEKDIDGASVPGDTPLSFALTEYSTTDDSQAILQLLDTLAAGGADFTKQGPGGTPLALLATLQSSEEVFIKFANLAGTLPQHINLNDISIPLAGGLAAKGWSKALELWLDQYPTNGEAAGHLLGESLRYAVCGTEEHTLEASRLLLDRGANINEISKDGLTPLYAASRLYYQLRHEMGGLIDQVELRTQRLEKLLTLLLSRGANPSFIPEQDASPQYPGFSAADFLTAQPDFIQKLTAQGITLPSASPDFTEGIPLLSEICRRSINPEYRLREQDIERVQAVLTPTPDMAQTELYEMALPRAIRLLTQHDPTRAAQALTNSPLWQHLHSQSNSTPSCDCGNHYATLVEAITANPQLVMPADFLLRETEHCLRENQHELAANLIELLHRCPDAEDRIAPLLQDKRLAVQAGAWGARLLLEGLPTPRAESVKDWLSAHQRSADTPALQKALRLTSQEDFWYGNMSQDDIRLFLQDILDIGAPHAHELYSKLAQHLNNPEKLDEFATRIGDATYELEIATARFILEHKTDFLNPTPPPQS